MSHTPNSVLGRGKQKMREKPGFKPTADQPSAAASVAPGSGRKVSVAGSGAKRRRMSTQSYGSGVNIPK